MGGFKAKGNPMSGVLISVLALMGVILQPALGRAQVTPSPVNHLGTAVGTAPLALGGTQYNITGGRRPGDGPNLFQSYGTFSIGSRDIANFSNTMGLGIVMIIGRVTGGEVSNIAGRIQTEGFGANPHLFLINPAGVILAPTGILNVASLRVSTANSVRFPDLPGAPPTQVKFLATDSPLPADGLTVEPTAFGFESPNPLGITVRSNVLLPTTGQTLSLVGGNAPLPGEAEEGVKITGPLTLRAQGGQIQIVSVAAPMDVPLTGDVGVGSGLGRIAISNGAVLNVSSPTAVSATPAGSVLIRGGRIFIEGGASIRVDTGNATPVGPTAVDIQGNTVSLTDGAFIRARSLGTGQSRDVRVTATEWVDISGSSRISSEAQSSGAGGKLIISAPSVSLTDGSTISSTMFGTFETGRSGDIVMELGAGGLTVTGAGEITSTAGGQFGRSGDVTVTAAGSVSLSGAGSRIFTASVEDASTGGGAGKISLDISGKLTLKDGAQVQSGDPFLQGADITVRAGDSVLISGVGSGISSQAFSKDVGQVAITTPRFAISDGGFLRASTSGGGNAGTLLLDARTVTLNNNAQVASSSEGAATDGAGGNIRLSGTDSVSIGGGAGVFSTAEGIGPGGNITISGREVNLTDRAIVSAKSTGEDTALAGNVTINAGSKLVMRNSTITTESLLADGGNISVTTSGSLVHLSNSQITTSVQSGIGGGGNITMDSQLLVLDASRINADAFGGPGGNIDITAQVYLAPNSLVTASSALSTPGEINIQASVTDVSGTLARLPEAILQAAGLLPASCAARLAGGKSSSLVLAGREGVPLEPGGLLPSPLIGVGPADALRLSGGEPPRGAALL